MPLQNALPPIPNRRVITNYEQLEGFETFLYVDGLSKAKAETRTGPKDASMVATIAAGQTGKNANDIARYFALSLTGLVIAATQLVALLGGQAYDTHFARSESPRRQASDAKAAAKA
jgi:hypothetical protein